MAEPWRGTRIVLETGDPWEVLPSDMPHFRAHAEAYCASKDTDPEGRARVRGVWLEGKKLPSWQKFTPVKGLAKRVTAQASGVTIEADTGEVVDVIDLSENVSPETVAQFADEWTRQVTEAAQQAAEDPF